VPAGRDADGGPERPSRGHAAGSKLAEGAATVSLARVFRQTLRKSGPSFHHRHPTTAQLLQLFPQPGERLIRVGEHADTEALDVGDDARSGESARRPPMLRCTDGGTRGLV